MVNPSHPLGLRKKACKSWNHFISDEIMYAAEVRDRKLIRKQEGTFRATSKVISGLRLLIMDSGTKNEKPGSLRDALVGGSALVRLTIAFRMTPPAPYGLVK